jgi:hypothetical protein
MPVLKTVFGGRFDPTKLGWAKIAAAYKDFAGC